MQKLFINKTYIDLSWFVRLDKNLYYLLNLRELIPYLFYEINVSNGIIKLLLLSGLDVNYIDFNESTLLYEVCDNYNISISRKMEIIKLLLNLGANPFLKGRLGDTSYDRLTSINYTYFDDCLDIMKKYKSRTSL